MLLASMLFPLFMLLLAPMLLHCPRPASSEMEITKHRNPFVLEITNIWQKSGRLLVLNLILKSIGWFEFSYGFLVVLNVFHQYFHQYFV
jgi:hypothetical protein